MQDNKKKKKFKLFDINRDGKGVEKGEIKDLTFKNYFKFYFRNITRLLNTNLLFVLYIFPIFFALLGLTGYFDTYQLSPTNDLSSIVLGAMKHGDTNPVNLALYGAVGVQFGTVRLTSTVTYALYGVGLLAVLLWGYANTGLAYVLRNTVRFEPVAIWSDFKYAVSRNKLQGFLLGVVDLGICFVLGYDIVFFISQTGTGFANNFMFWLSVIIALIYMMMRFYMYILLVTFDLSIFKIFKNSFIFAFLGFKRNILALINCAALIFLNYMLVLVFTPLGMSLPFFLTIATLAFSTTYAAYPKIDELMIRPYYKENPPSDEIAEAN